MFRGNSADDAAEGPPGFHLASQMQTALRAAHFQLSELDNWRDCGWSMRVRISSGGEIELALALMTEPDVWMLQIACVSDPGLLARLFGRRFVDRSDDVLAVAMAVQSELHRFAASDIRWQVDGDLEGGGSTPAPQRPTQMKQ